MKRFLFLILAALLLVGPVVIPSHAIYVNSDIRSPTINRVVTDLATLKATSGVSTIKAVHLMGGLTEGDGREGDFRWISGDQSANPGVVADTDQGVYIKLTSPGDGSTGVWQRLAVHDLNPKWFGAPIDGSSDDTPALQAMNDFIVALDEKKTISIAPSDTSVTLNTPLDIDVSFVSIDWGNNKIDATNLVGAYAIKLFGSEVSNQPRMVSFAQNTSFLRSGRLFSSGKANGITALLYDGDVGTAKGPNRLRVVDFFVDGFQEGLSFNNRTYLLSFDNITVRNCGTAIIGGSGLTDAGENIRFTNSLIGLNDVAISLDDPMDLNFSNTSFDFNLQLYVPVGTGGQINLSNCHVELSNSVSTAVTDFYIDLPNANGNTFVMRGGTLLVTDGTHFTADSLVRNLAPAINSGGVIFDNVFMHNLEGATEYFSTGTGYVSGRNSVGFDVNNNPDLLSAEATLTVDGGFEGTSVEDNVFITEDTAAITDALTGTNISLAVSALEANSGSQSLLATKVSGPGSAAVFALAVPIEKGSRPNARFYYTKPDAQTGTMAISTGYITLKNNSDGVPVIAQLESRASTNVVFTATPVGWTKQVNGQPFRRAPVWATHYFVRINLNLMQSGNVFFDDLEISGL